jgi:hypothetical protein
MTTIAPKDGYATETKERWRDWVYSRVGGWDNQSQSVVTGNVLCMPSREGAEIEHIKTRGFTEQQIFVADKNPAIVASLKRRFPLVHTFGVEIHRACQRIAQEQTQLCAAVLDYCGRLSAVTTRSIAMCAESGALSNAHVFVNVLRGREDAAERRLMPNPLHGRLVRRYLKEASRDWWESIDDHEPTELDLRRIVFVGQLFNRPWSQAMSYTSTNGQPFLTIWMEPQT